MRRIQIIDSHTEGEPTRVVVAGGPNLGHGSLAERRAIFRDAHDDFRGAVVNEPRGSDVLVGAILCEPTRADCVAAVVFFNNVGVLNMCGHGAIGVARTLAHLGRVSAGSFRLETPVGVVTCQYDGAATVAIDNVPSERFTANVAVDVPGVGRVVGDVAWGGNWFFLVREHGERLTLDNVERLTDVTWRIRQALPAAGITGRDGAEIDHVELFGPPLDPGNNSRNFVLCPGKAYDRSPCGTGTSAKLACLFADGKLALGETWRQESIIGGVFTGSLRREGQSLIPTISGRAFITAEATLLIDEADPFAAGIRT